MLDHARRGTLPGSVQTGATFADAAAEFLRYVEQDRTCKPSTLRDYRSSINRHLLPAFGEMCLEDGPGPDATRPNVFPTNPIGERAVGAVPSPTTA